MNMAYSPNKNSMSLSMFAMYGVDNFELTKPVGPALTRIDQVGVSVLRPTVTERPSAKPGHTSIGPFNYETLRVELDFNTSLGPCITVPYQCLSKKEMVPGQ